jgi:hypothetical protein
MFFENHNSFYTCVKKSGVGFMGIELVQRRHFNSLAKTKQKRTMHRIGSGEGEREVQRTITKGE